MGRGRIVGELACLLAVLIASSTARGGEVKFLDGDVTAGQLIKELETPASQGIKPVDSAPPVRRPTVRGDAARSPSGARAGTDVGCTRYRAGLHPGQVPDASAAVSNPTKQVDVSILFAPGSDELTPEASHNLDELGKALTSTELAGSCWVVAGHTDDVGTDEYNRDLSIRRANRVVEYLRRDFKIHRDQVIAVGYGERRPRAENSDDGGRRQNRRVGIGKLGS